MGKQIISTSIGQWKHICQTILNYLPSKNVLLTAEIMKLYGESINKSSLIKKTKKIFNQTSDIDWNTLLQCLQKPEEEREEFFKSKVDDTSELEYLWQFIVSNEDELDYEKTENAIAVQTLKLAVKEILADLERYESLAKLMNNWEAYAKLIDTLSDQIFFAMNELEECHDQVQQLQKSIGTISPSDCAEVIVNSGKYTAYVAEINMAFEN